MHTHHFHFTEILAFLLFLSFGNITIHFKAILLFFLTISWKTKDQLKKPYSYHGMMWHQSLTHSWLNTPQLEKMPSLILQAFQLELYLKWPLPHKEGETYQIQTVNQWEANLRGTPPVQASTYLDWVGGIQSFLSLSPSQPCWWHPLSAMKK